MISMSDQHIDANNPAKHATEDSLEVYCRSIGIPKDQATLLSSFVYKSSQAIGDTQMTGELM